MQQASYLEGGPLMFMLPLHINKKTNDDDDDWAWSVYLTTLLLGRLSPLSV